MSNTLSGARRTRPTEMRLDVAPSVLGFLVWVIAPVLLPVAAYESRPLAAAR